MFGYVIPIRCELKMREFDQFRAAYCGLCQSLRENYGRRASFILNYDFTFLALLLSAKAGEVKYSRRRCVANPLCKKRCCDGGAPFRQAAGYSVILAWWRLRDDIADSGLVKGLSYRLICQFLHRAYRRARADFSAFDLHCSTALANLRELERGNSQDLDRVADTFASILPFAAEAGEGAPDERVLRELLYHTGRWIYLVDACDDLKEDMQSGNYNPLAARFAAIDGVLNETDRAWLKTTLDRSGNLIAAAYNLLPSGAWGGILDNIIYLGFPAVTQSVLEGRHRRRWGRWVEKVERKEQDS